MESRVNVDLLQPGCDVYPQDRIVVVTGPKRPYALVSYNHGDKIDRDRIEREIEELYVEGEKVKCGGGGDAN